MKTVGRVEVDLHAFLFYKFTLWYMSTNIINMERLLVFWLLFKRI